MTKTKENWSKIPIEILSLITTYCGKDCTQVKWMFVNKFWFAFYLSVAYSSIKTSLGDEHVINKTLSSSFDVGKYVKRIHLYNIQIPTDLNKLDVNNDILGRIMKRTPNVREVSISRETNEANQSGSCQSCANHDWPYFSMVLIGVKCWELQQLPNLGENNMVSAANYYACAYYSRRTLKRLEISFNALSPQDIGHLKEFTELEVLEVHKNLINGLNEIDFLLQFTPKLRELTIRFSTGRVYQSIKKENITYSGIKKLWLYNFNPQDNDELLALAQKFFKLENLYIFGERDKTWLSEIDEFPTVNNFLKNISLIPKCEIMIPGYTQETCFIKPWLESIESSKRDVCLSHIYNEEWNPNYINSQSDTVATFYGGSVQSTPLLQYTKTNDQTHQDIYKILKVLANRSINCLRLSGVVSGLEDFLKQIIDKKPSYLKQIIISNSTLGRSHRTNTTPALQLIKSIIFCNCKLYLLPLKLFIDEFNSLEDIKFDACSFNGGTNIDISNTDIKSIKMVNFRKMMSEQTYNSKIQTVIAISIYFAVQDLTRYFYVVDDNLIEITKDTFVMFNDRFSIDEVVALNIKVKSLQQLLLQLTETSKIFDITFSH